MPKLFVSYAHADAKKILQQVRDLQSFGYDVWIDTPSIQGGDLWENEIADAISRCDAFLLFLSSSSMKSDQVRSEVQLAYKKNRRIIPIRLDRVEIPYDLQFELAGIQWIDAKEAQFMPRLLAALGTPGTDQEEEVPAPLKVVVLYSTPDREKVNRIYEDLRRQNFLPWMDIHDLRPSENKELGVRNAVMNCDIVLLCLSRQGILAEMHLHDPIRFVVNYVKNYPEKHIFLIPVKLDDCIIPNILKDWQWISLYDNYARGLQRLIFSMVLRDQDFSEETRELLARESSTQRKVFVAMPFSTEMEDVYFYGIQRAVNSVGFNCYRSDKVAFVGDILQEIKKELESSAAIVADLTESNPNVYLEVGFAWGRYKPTILIMKQGDKLHFDVQGQKCLMYKNIKHLEEILTKELLELRASGAII